jgi:hypothetical protein
MLYREAYVLNRFVLVDNGVMTVPLGLRDVITGLFVELRANNGATSNVANLLADCLTSFELIDGSTSLVYLTGYQLLAKTCYDKGYFPYNLITEIGGNTQNLVGYVPFGRWHGDTVYAFDPTRFVAPMIRLTWNLAAIRAVAATAFATGTATITVIAEIMQGAPAPQAMITAKQIYNFVTAAAGTTYVPFPMDHRIKACLLRSYNVAGGAIYGISNVKLNCDTGKFVYFDLRDMDVVRLMTLRNPPFSYKHGFVISNGTTIFPIMKWDEVVELLRDSGDTTFGYQNNAIGSGVVSVFTAGAADANPRVVWGNVLGWVPFALSYLDLGEFDDPATWFDPTPYGSINLELTNAAANGVASVALEQEFIY